MRTVIKGAKIKITAVIDSCQMSVADLDRLEVGGLFPLTDVTLDDVMLEMKVADEVRAVGHGRLGTFKRNKAIKLIETPDRAFLEPLADELTAMMNGESGINGEPVHE